MGTILDEAGKSQIAAQEFEAVLRRDLTIVRNEPWRRLSGVHSVSGGKNLAVARELWQARDDYAREIDMAPGRLVPDSALVAAARALPKSKRDLASIKAFTGRASRSQIDRWWLAIQAGVASTDPPLLRATGESIPPPRVWAEKNPEADRRLKLARAAVTEVSTLMNIPVENLLTPESLRRLAWAPPAPLDLPSVQSAMRELGARDWQREATAEVIHDAFVDARQVIEEPLEEGS